LPKKTLKKGLIQVYTGDGKGKTTAALGLALRALGHGLSVYMIQFLKGSKATGEFKMAKRLSPNLVIKPMGRNVFVDTKRPAKIDRDLAKNALDLARKIMMGGDYDIVILDEVNVAVHMGLIPIEDLLELIQQKPSHVEVVLTGRYAKPQIIDRADLVTEMRNVRHYYDKRISGRKGIEM